MANLTSSLSRRQPPEVQSCRRPSPPPGPVTRAQQIVHKALSTPAKRFSPPIIAHTSSSSGGETHIESVAASRIPASDRSQKTHDGFPKRDPSAH